MALLISALVLAGCGGAPSGATEPIRVRQGSFHEGELPVNEGAATPAIQYAASAGFIVTQGQGSIDFRGAMTADAYSVAVSFPGAGTGYWVVPAGAVDPTQGGALLFGFTVDFGEDVPYGEQGLALAALDGEGRPGPRYDVSLCVLPEYADGNLSSCEESIASQGTILSLAWDTPVDLDLVVVTPDGKLVSPKDPSTALPDEDGEIPDEALDDPATGVLTRDSNANCELDGLNLESLIFAGTPAAGDWEVYADLYSACDADSVRFGVTLFEREEGADGADSLRETPVAQGTLRGSQADAGTRLGTHVATLSFP